MRYIVYDRKTGAIVRSYRRIQAESGEEMPAEESAILAGLPVDLTEKDVDILSLRHFVPERGKQYRVDPANRELVATPMLQKQDAISRKSARTNRMGK